MGDEVTPITGRDSAAEPDSLAGSDVLAGRDSADAGEPLAGRDYGEVLWTPTKESADRAQITRFARWLAADGRLTGPAAIVSSPGSPESAGTGNPSSLAGISYHDLWQWSVDDLAGFWSAVWDYFEVAGARGDGPVLRGQMPQVSWFEGSTLNYARNALRHASRDPQHTAVKYSAETGRSGELSYGDLAAQVARVRQGLVELGVGFGDRVAAYLPNSPEALIGLLAAASLGAIWTSCSPDFGAHSVIDRFAQISPKVLLAVDGYVYNGRRYDRRPEVAAIAAALPGLEALVLVDYLGAPASQPGEAGAGLEVGVPVFGWADFGPDGAQAASLEFAEVPFDHPLWVLYSSGTTGLPKPIVHGHGGIVLEHLKMLALHQDLTSADTFFWYTTTGWMMWNYLAGGLLVGASIVLYDGSATYAPGASQPDTAAMWRLVAQTRATYAGTGAPYLLTCLKAGLRPAADLDLSALRGVGSTGSPLTPEGFRWVYQELGTGPAGLILGSISGGTDVCTAFVGPNPLLPVRAGVISGPCLGARVESFDPAGRPLRGAVGELVLTQPMPSMPVGFWNDPGGERYLASYFADYPGVWRHGDWIEILPDGGCIIFGRSDATLNRGGVRMGTSEFYRVVEAMPEVADSLVVDTGQLGQDGRLILYVVAAEDVVLDEALTARIRSLLRAELSPRHVPDEIHQVPGIPRTLSGKKLEVPVRRILLGTPVSAAADPDALANPEVLSHFAPGRAAAG
ncbi:MAG TPA: acetoacetate--CoA ligase [Streptosporangiaceae bacterium]